MTLGKYKRLKLLPDFFINCFGNRAVIFQLVRVELTARYRRTLVGYGWTLLNPLFTMLVLTIVFSTLFNLPFDEFGVFLIAGMMPWLMFLNTVGKSLSSFTANEAILKKVAINKTVFPVAASTSVLLDSIFSFFAFLLVIFALGGVGSISLLFIPFAYLLLYIFCVGVSFAISIYATFYRDLNQIIPILLQGMFFLTPIIYRPESLVGKAYILVQLNPLVPFLELFRVPILSGQFPDVDLILYCLILSLISFFVGLAVYHKNHDRLTISL